MTQTQPVDKAHLTKVTLSISLLSTVGNIYTVTVPNAGKGEELHSVCPKCRAPKQFLSQKLCCKDDSSHGPFDRAEIRMGSMVGDKIVVVDAEQVKSARQSILPKGNLDLQVHRREDVALHTFAKGNAHVFFPYDGTTNEEVFGVLIALLKKRRDLVLIAKTNLKNVDHLIMVDVEMNDQLVLREMVWPEDMKTFPVAWTAPEAKNLAMAEQIADAMAADFVLSEYKKDSRDRVAAVIENATTTKVTKKSKAPKKVDDSDLAVLLEAALADKKRKAA